jgi:hypothetical protein
VNLVVQFTGNQKTLLDTVANGGFHQQDDVTRARQICFHGCVLERENWIGLSSSLALKNLKGGGN